MDLANDYFSNFDFFEHEFKRRSGKDPKENFELYMRFVEIRQQDIHNQVMSKISYDLRQLSDMMRNWNL